MRLKPCTVIKAIMVLMLFSGLAAYIFFNTRLFVQGPQIIINGPENGFSSDFGLVEVHGQVLNSSFISLNGRAVLIDENSNFSESVLLYPGYNILIIEAKDKFDRQVNKQLDLVYNVDASEVFDYESGDMDDSNVVDDSVAEVGVVEGSAEDDEVERADEI